MILAVTAAPSAEPITLAQAKAHLRVTHDAEDDLIAALLAAARARVEAAVGVCLLTTGLSQTGAADARGVVRLLRGPLVGVDAVALVDGAGGWAAPLPAEALRTRTSEAPAQVRLLAWPGGCRGGDPATVVRVDYRAGYGDAPEAAPAGLVQAVLAMVADAYDRRGEGAPPSAVVAEAWLSPFRVGRL